MDGGPPNLDELESNGGSGEFHNDLEDAESGPAEQPPPGPPQAALARRESPQQLPRIADLEIHPPAPARVARSPQNQQQLLRQQAHSPIAGAPPARALAAAGGNVYGGRAFGYHALRIDPNNPNVPERDMDGSVESSSPSPTASGWSEVEHSLSRNGVRPSARSLHAAALLGGTLYLFGGYDGSQRVNTFHSYSFTDKRWSAVLPSANSAPPPSPRDRHVAVAFGSSVYIQGGFDGVARVSDFWGFNCSTMTWTQIHALHGRPPSPRHSHSAVVYRDSMYIGFGYDGSYKNDLYEFNFTLSRWSIVPAVGRRPRARYRATCVTWRNYMILFAGHDGTRHLNDTHCFDFDTQTWTTVVCEGPPPIPRDSHVSVVHGDCMIIFAGSSGSAMNDLHELQLPSTPNLPAKWREIHTSGTVQPRFCHVAVCYNSSIWVHGGYSGSERLDDFVRFDFSVYDLSFEVPPSTILAEFRSLINDSTVSDITFIVEDQPVYAHKLMLMRCEYFQGMFSGNMRESTMDTIRLEHVRYPVFLSILQYLYTDSAVIPLEDAMELFEAADRFGIPRLMTMCQKRMLQSITVDNAAEIFHAADMHSATALRQKAKKYILSHFEEVSKSSSFEEMGRRNIDLVFELLQSR